MVDQVIDALRSILGSLWEGLGSLNVPGTFMSWRTVLVAPFGFAVFVFALNKILNMSAHQGISGVARNAYRKYQKEDD